MKKTYEKMKNIWKIYKIEMLSFIKITLFCLNAFFI